MKATVNSCDIYIGGWCLYYLQGSLYASGSVLSQSILLCLLLSSLYYFFVVNVKNKFPLFLKFANVLLLMFVYYGLLLIFSGEERHFEGGGTVVNFEYLKQVCMSFLPMFAFYYFALMGKLTEQRLRIYSVVFFVVACFSFIDNYNNQLQKALMEGSSREEFTNNVGYEFVAILPLLYAWRERVFVQYLFLFALSCFVFMSMKRGAILIHCVCMIVFLYKMFKIVNSRQRVLMALLLLLLLAIGAYCLFSFYENSIYFQRRMERTMEGDSSGRDMLLLKLFNAWLGFDFFSLLFGKGADATISIAGNYAHNDWFELLINQGLLGITLYICYFLGLYFEIKKAKKTCRTYSTPLLLLFIILFVSSLFSMSYSSISIFLSISVGYYLYRNNVKVFSKKQTYNGNRLCVFNGL